MKKKVFLAGMFGMVLTLGMVVVSCATVGIGKAETSSFDGITTQTATLYAMPMSYGFVKITKASKEGQQRLTLSAYNIDNGTRNIDINVDGKIYTLDASDVDFQVYSSKYGVNTWRQSWFLLSPDITEAMSSGQTITFRYQGNVFKSSLAQSELKTFLGF